MRRLAVAAAAAAALSCAAQEAAPPFEIRAHVQRENLDHGQPDWREDLLDFAWKLRPSTTLSAGARATERFDLKDREGFAAAYVPLGAHKTLLHLEGSGSSTHRVLPEAMGLAEVIQPLAGGWVVSGGARLSRYTSSDVQMLTATLEKYFGDYRLAYTVYLSRPEGAGWAPAHRVALSWHRSALTFLTLAAARGREVESLPTGLLVTEVRAVALGGGFEILPHWGLTFEVGHVRQGDLYTRRGARIGTRILF